MSSFHNVISSFFSSSFFYTPQFWLVELFYGNKNHRDDSIAAKGLLHWVLSIILMYINFHEQELNG